MKAILEKFWAFLKRGNNLIIAIITALFLLLGAILYFQHNKIINLTDKYQTEVKYKNALIDTVHYYTNSHNEMVAEKLTLQVSVKFLTQNNKDLNASQQELVKRVGEIQKSNYIISAALVQTNVKLDSIQKAKVSVNAKDSSITFSDSTKNLKYNIEIDHVKPVSVLIAPTLKFNDFELPNKQFIEFHWKDNKKEGFPVAFSISNSNNYFKSVNINSYAIPELKKEVVNPSGWQKFGQFFVKNGKTFIYVGVGVAGGIGVYKLLGK